MMPEDNFYYIKDFSGNYYCADALDQLMVARCVEDASLFDYETAMKHISGGRKSKFYYIISADEQQDKESTINCLVKEESAEAAARSAEAYDLSNIDWEEYLTHFIYIAKGIKIYEEELCKQQSDIDQKICDVLHYIELCETDGDEAQELVELLRVCREKRRDIKDEMTRITYFKQYFAVDNSISKATQALKSIRGLKTRKYKPRKYAELFENCTWKPERKEHLRKTQEAVQQDMMPEKEITIVASEMPKEEEEETMELMWRETPYDEGENDWLAFAKQQAKFYRNAPQYIDNLQLELEELDMKIEEVLCNMEDAKCNAMQGYMVFKTLKELRTSRKKKLKELQCIYALTEHYNCQVMAENCEADLAAVMEVIGEGENVVEIPRREAPEQQCEETAMEQSNITEMIG